MDGIKEIADSFGAELKHRLPKQRKTQRTKLALLVATMLDVRSANLMELAAGLPREADRTDMRYQWITRLLGNPLVISDEIMEPFSHEVLEQAAGNGAPLTLILDQSKMSDRHQVLMLFVEGRMRRERARLFGIARKTVDKMCACSAPPGYRRRSPAAKPKLDGFTGIIDQILADDQRMPAKQKHTAKRIFERLRDEYGFTGHYTIVKSYIHDRQVSAKEMFVPLHHPTGHAQVDFGEAMGLIGGVARKLHFF